MSASSALSALVGPFRYASAKGFANLHAVKGLKALLEGAVAKARAEGVDAAALAVLEREAAHVDSSDEAERRAAVTRVGQTLASLGLPVGFEAVTARPLEAPKPLPRVKAEEEEALPAPDDELPVEKPKAKRRGKAAASEEDEPARLLSIAPAAGPLSTPLKAIGIRLNPRLIGLLNKKGIRRAGDVLFLLPRVYEDRRQMKKIAQLRAGERETIVAEVRKAEDVVGRSRRKMFRAVLGDGTGTIAVTYFQTGPWLKARFPVGKKLVISGEVRNSQWGWEIAHPEVEPAIDLESSAVHFNRIVPVYPGFERFEQRGVRELAFRIAERFASSLEDALPEELRVRMGLLDLPEAIRRIHFPPDDEDVAQLDAHQSPAHRRLAFDELFFLQLGMALRRQGVKVQPGISFDASGARIEKAKALLPFQLTGAQSRVVEQVSRDMARPEPMNRLVQGDVGSGKTAVALVAAGLALQDGFQVAVMAPTEILAEQHHQNFARLLAPLGARVALITGGGTAKHRREQRAALRDGTLHVAVGTHALIEGSVELAKLGLVVIDEQHRFGVIQRHALMDKGLRPDVLVMTATPIPRTLAMTLYGDLDVSIIDELPPGRTPIVTRVFVEKARPRAYEQVQAELDKGHQAYVVYPLVEESEKVDLADATRGAAELAKIFPNAKVGLLHGRMKNEEKDEAMTAFRARQVDILVCTTVVEVGVDVPNASVMLIESAERFGLSQLHQLRGRVGRGAAKSFCFLLTGYAKSEEARARLQVMEESNDGFVIAERDLDLRGPGEFLGTRQSGMPELAVANLSRDQALLATAQDEARAIVAKDPRLERPEHAPLVRALEERWEGRLKLAQVG
ncbi:MAG: ATP-dependent DNA helicase RecG [Archangiaceae bacterium]|nr:ATP-dependent DNA helicase RecG [Archangiaceae bacterium]